MRFRHDGIATPIALLLHLLSISRFRKIDYLTNTFIFGKDHIRLSPRWPKALISYKKYRAISLGMLRMRAIELEYP